MSKVPFQSTVHILQWLHAQKVVVRCHGCAFDRTEARVFTQKGAFDASMLGVTTGSGVA
jgi:hypothetical protein